MNRDKPRSLSLQAAELISSISHPLYISPLVIMVASMSSTDSVWSGLYWWSLYQVFSAVLPLADLIWRRRTGRISDWHVSRREERKWPIVFGIIYAAAGSLAIFLLSGPRILIACMLSGLVLGIIIVTVTSFWKISLHMMGSASLAVILYAALGAGFVSTTTLLLFLYLLIVGISRLAVKAHSPAQVIAGGSVGIAVTWLIFQLMGLLV